MYRKEKITGRMDIFFASFIKDMREIPLSVPCVAEKEKGYEKQKIRPAGNAVFTIQEK